MTAPRSSGEAAAPTCPKCSTVEVEFYRTLGRFHCLNAECDHVWDASPSPVSAAVTPWDHELKVWRQYGDDIDSRVKTFEFRIDDRTPRYHAGDVLRLREWGSDYTGREWLRRVTYVARGGVIPSGYCVMSIIPEPESFAASPPVGEPDALIEAVDRLEHWHGIYANPVVTEYIAAIRRGIATLTTSLATAEADRHFWATAAGKVGTQLASMQRERDEAKREWDIACDERNGATAELRAIAELFGIEPCHDDEPPSWVNMGTGNGDLSLVELLRPYAAAEARLTAAEQRIEAVKQKVEGLTRYTVDSRNALPRIVESNDGEFIRFAAALATLSPVQETPTP